MDDQCSPLLTWGYYCQGKSMDELRQSLLLITLELETTRAKAQEELKMRDDQLNHLKCLMAEAIRERDEAQENCQRLIFERYSLLQQLQLQQQQCQQRAPLSGVSTIEDEPRRGLDSNNGFSSSDCEESIVSSPVTDPTPPSQLPPPPPSLQEPTIPVVSDKPLPEKGKLLQAVMKAGPLLQTLLLAGPLPQWRHPPPPLDSCQIPPPPVTIPPPPPPPAQLPHQDSLLSIDRRRSLCEGSYSPTESKYQRLVLH